MYIVERRIKPPDISPLSSSSFRLQILLGRDAAFDYQTTRYGSRDVGGVLLDVIKLFGCNLNEDLLPGSL
jgi:hypothetical protein